MDLKLIGKCHVAGERDLKQLVKYLKDNDLLPDFQPAHSANHSTETVVFQVLADILLALDSGDLAMLTILDISAK